MTGKSSFDDGKAQSLVFQFAESLSKEGDFTAPEPDFLKWMENAVFVDIGTSSDEAEDSRQSEKKRRVWRAYHTAIEATSEFLDFFKTDLPLLREISGHMMFLPTLISLHPDNERFNRDLLRTSGLGSANMASGCMPKPQHLAAQSWATRYAYAIITTIDLTLDTYQDKLSLWAQSYGCGVKHPIPMAAYVETAKRMGWDEEKRQRELPKYEGHYHILPVWTQTLKKLRRPFNPEHVIDYWRTGKEMLREEMSKFHLRPEWESYRRRHYKTGSKTGAVQNAIFKDILAAMRTIAGTYHRRSPSNLVTK